MPEFDGELWKIIQFHLTQEKFFKKKSACTNRCIKSYWKSPNFIANLIFCTKCARLMLRAFFRLHWFGYSAILFHFECSRLSSDWRRPHGDIYSLPLSTSIRRNRNIVYRMRTHFCCIRNEFETSPLGDSRTVQTVGNLVIKLWNVFQI